MKIRLMGYTPLKAMIGMPSWPQRLPTERTTTFCSKKDQGAGLFATQKPPHASTP